MHLVKNESTERKVTALSLPTLLLNFPMARHHKQSISNFKAQTCISKLRVGMTGSNILNF